MEEHLPPALLFEKTHMKYVFLACIVFLKRSSMFLMFLQPYKTGLKLEERINNQRSSTP